MTRDYVEIALVVDNSGSMDLIKDDAEGGLNNLIKEQKKIPGRCNVTLVNFSDTPEVIFESKPIEEVERLAIKPKNYTALNDAVGITINRLGERLRKMHIKDRPDKVIVAIVTDGQENRSKEFSSKAIADMIKHQQEKYSWEFIFIGVGENTFEIAKKMNIRTDNTMSYTATPIGAKLSYTSLDNKFKAIRGNQDYDMSKDSIK